MRLCFTLGLQSFRSALALHFTLTLVLLQTTCDFRLNGFRDLQPLTVSRTKSDVVDTSLTRSSISFSVRGGGAEGARCSGISGISGPAAIADEGRGTRV